VQVWQSLTGHLDLTYHGNTNWVTAVAWSFDGNELASGGLDTTVQVWNARSGKTLLTYMGHVASVTAIAWSPDSKRLASVGFDKSVQVWNATTGRTVWIYCCQGWVNGITWSPDGRSVASANTSKTVQVWQSTTGTPEWTYRDHHSEVLAVAWSPDGTRIASGDEDGIVRVWQAPLACKCAPGAIRYTTYAAYSTQQWSYMMRPHFALVDCRLFPLKAFPQKYPLHCRKGTLSGARNWSDH